MHFKDVLWGHCLLASVVVSMHPHYLRNLPYIAAPLNNFTSTAIPTYSNLCELGPPGANSVAETTGGPATTTCSDCTTISGVVVGTIVPSTLIPTNQTASYADDITNNKRASLTVIPQETLMPRAPVAVPLLDPDPNDQMNFMFKLMTSIKPADGALDITPASQQVATWTIPLTIDGATVNTPIGVTGFWYPWPSVAKNWKMVGMSGCTGVIIVGNSGFWAGHFWESSLTINGGSSFMHRSGPGDQVEIRPLADFKKIAVDILGEPSPPSAVSFVSLYDLQNKRGPDGQLMYGDPFSVANGGGDIFIITKAKASSPPMIRNQQMYSDQITALTTTIRKYVKLSTVSVRTYIGDSNQFLPLGDDDDWQRRSPANVPLTLNGVSILQYSPFAGTSKTGCPEARARIYEEINPKAAVDRKWAATLNKRDGAACGLLSSVSSSSSISAARLSSSTIKTSLSSSTAITSQSSLTTKITPSPSAITGALPCLPFEDPDSGMKGGICQCKNGAKIPMATSTNSAGLPMSNCPWTTIPPQALTTPAPTPKSTNTLQYQYTYTDMNKKVIECQSFSSEHVASYPVSICEGSSAVIYEPPLFTIELGPSKVNVGTAMTGDALVTSVSSAVKKACPTPTSEGAWTSCTPTVVKVGEATWLNKNEPEKGTLTIHIPESQYNSTNYLELFTQMVSGATNASATGPNCKLLDWAYTTFVAKRDIYGREIGPPEPIQHKGKDTFCNINGAFDTQFYDGVQETAKMWFEAEFGFDLGELGDYDCDKTLGVVETVVGSIFEFLLPEFSWLIATGVELASLACKAVDDFNALIGSRQENEKDIADAKLARAWAKEMKKDRKLPMSEAKKRELGLID